jgi:Ca2+-transporting ATPase
VYAEISSAQRLRIVRTLKEKDKVTALIGGYTCDAVSMAEADVGIAAGRTCSSEVTEAADMVAMNDSFASVIDAIAVMRGAYGNARKLIRYFLSGSLAMAGTMLVSLIISLLWENFPYPPLFFSHILWIGLVAISIPAISIIFDPAAGDAAKDRPYLRGNVLDNTLRSEILIRGVITTVLALIAFAFSLGKDINHGRAVAATLTLLVITQLAFAFQCRRASDEGFFRKYLSNKLLLAIVLFAVLLHLSVIYIPAISELFGIESLRLIDWIPILIALVICSLPLDELFRSSIEIEDEEETDEMIIEVAAEEEITEEEEIAAEEETPEDSDEETI